MDKARIFCCQNSMQTSQQDMETVWGTECRLGNSGPPRIAIRFRVDQMRILARLTSQKDKHTLMDIADSLSHLKGLSNC